MKNNISKIYLANFLIGTVFWYSIEKLFMQDIGITPLGVGINAAAFLVITVIFDIPSGILADKWNRKYTLMLAAASLALSSLVLGSSNSLTGYLIGTVLFGAYMVLTSGTFQAIMYDSLLDMGLSKSYDRYQGRAYAFFLFGVSVSALAGGYIADSLGYRAAFYLTAIFSAAAFVVFMLVKEPTHHKHESDTKILSHAKSSVSLLLSKDILMHLAVFIAVAGMLRGSMNEYSGLYYIALGLTAIPTGYANAAKWLASTIGQVIAARIGRVALRFIPLFFVAFFAFTLFESLWGLPFFYMAVFLHAILSNQAEAEIQDNTPSHIRATTISVIGFMTNIILIGLSLVFGWVTQEYSVYVAYQVFAGIGLLYLISWAVRGRRVIRSAI